jgi:hypothetical protein
MAIELKQSESKRVLVRAFDSTTKASKTGLVFGDVSATVWKSDNTTQVVTVDGTTWEEETNGDFLNTGTYTLTLSALNLNTVGELGLAITATGCDKVVRDFKVVANEEVDTYTAISTIPTNPLLTNDARLPVTLIASQADVQAIDLGAVTAKTDLIPDIKIKTDNLPANPASQTDILATEAAILAAIPAAADPEAVLDAVLLDHLTSGSVGEALALIKGLVQDNFVLDQTTYNTRGVLLTGRIRLFLSVVDANAGTNPLAVFRITATTRVSPEDDLVTTYKVVRE